MNPVDLILQLGTWGQHHHREVLYGLIAAPVLVGATRLVQRHHRGASTVMGSARWATPREVRKAGLMTTHGVVVGHLNGRRLHDDSNTHVLLIGPTRSWKGRSVIIPTLLTWRHSALIFDPKDGENADVTAAWRGRLGRVELFTPCACLNVLDTIRLKTIREFGDAQLIAQSLTAPEKMAYESPTSLHFRELAAMLLTATFLHGRLELSHAGARQPGRLFDHDGHDGA